MSEEKLKDLVEFMVKSLVDNPEQVEVTVQGEETMDFRLKVAKEDTGKVIGKGGNTANSMRTILKAAASKLNVRRAVLNIDE